MKEVIGYKCKNCGKDKGKHSIQGMACPNPGRGNFRGFSTEKSYEPDHNKPVMGYKL
ncbi:hypothetical protein [Escherichia coli]|uniref:hypothetical protein n=1 Tax=Escherichia coli TaxID=562 RepID=UPI0021D3B358|nr:hypothetical protein [Escherichia coli]MCU6292784.1 hypothetical protein [Escherichia coli]